MPFVDCGGTSVEYTVTGGGGAPGLLLLHGTGQSGGNSWGAFAPHFYKTRAVLRPSYAGSGGTTMPDGPLTLDLLARQMLAAADAAGASGAGFEKFDIVGHSLGCCVAMRLALDCPARVGRLVLLAPFADGRDERLQAQFWLWRRLILSDRAAMAELSILSAFSPEFYAAQAGKNVQLFVELAVKHTNWDGMLRQIELDMAIDLTDRLGEITQPTLVIGCAKDFIVPPARHAKMIAAGIQGAVYRELDAGHAAVLERPAEFLAMAKEFLV